MKAGAIDRSMQRLWQPSPIRVILLILFGGMRKPNEDSKRGGSIPCESKSSHFVNVVQRRRELAEVTKPATSASMAIPTISGRT